jgi:hypothetical protein
MRGLTWGGNVALNAPVDHSFRTLHDPHVRT